MSKIEEAENWNELISDSEERKADELISELIRNNGPSGDLSSIFDRLEGEMVYGAFIDGDMMAITREQIEGMGDASWNICYCFTSLSAYNKFWHMAFKNAESLANINIKKMGFKELWENFLNSLMMASVDRNIVLKLVSDNGDVIGMSPAPMPEK